MYNFLSHNVSGSRKAEINICAENNSKLQNTSGATKKRPHDRQKPYSFFDTPTSYSLAAVRTYIDSPLT